MYLLTVLLSPDESHILIKANSREKKESEQITLKIYVKELMDYFEIDTLESTSNILKSTEKINSIKNFTSCFLDSLYIEDKTLKFNQRKKLQKLIELLNEDSVLNLDDSDVTTNKEGDPFTIQSTVELALRKNNYEQYLDTITTRVQKRVKGFLARKNFALKKDLGTCLLPRKRQGSGDGVKPGRRGLTLHRNEETEDWRTYRILLQFQRESVLPADIDHETQG